MLADRYDAFLFDLDGVLYRGTEPIRGAAAALDRLRASGKRLAFVTNNSGATPEGVVERLTTVGVVARAGEVETSALATSALLAGRGVRSAFVIGEEGIRRALSDAGIAVVDEPSGGVDVVVVGWDRSADYEKLRTASVLVQHGAALIATNPDGSYPASDGTNWPGAGALLAAVVATTGATPEVVGKPHPPILRAALARAGGGRPLVIGDRLDTDIAGAAGLGWDSLLVLTGISSREDAAGAHPAPTFVSRDLGGLFDDPG
jgi:HAD superfamily hydrolase (TIGR01457 family)